MSNRIVGSTEDKILARRRIVGECWEWTGSTNGDGYGSMVVAGRTERTHRLAAMLWLGFDPKSGLQVLHRCDNPPCFNPAHLWIGTNKDNMDDRDAKGRLNDRSGTLNGRAKLTEDEVRTIRALYALGASMEGLGRTYGVHGVTILRIVRREIWRTLDAGTTPAGEDARLGLPAQSAGNVGRDGSPSARTEGVE